VNQACLSLGPIKYGKKGQRAVIYSRFLACDTWNHMSVCLNKGNLQFYSSPVFDQGLLENLLYNSCYNYHHLL